MPLAEEIAMSLIALPLAFVLLGATDAPLYPPQAYFDEPLAAMRELQPDFLAGEQCRSRNLPTNDNPGRQPRLERGPAMPDMGQIIYAVDRRVDGCSVVLVKGNSIRPFGQIQLTPEELSEIISRR